MNEEYSFNNTFIDFENMNDEELKCFILKQKHATPTKKPNYLKIPVTRIDINYHGAKAMNRLIEYFGNYEGMKPIIRTHSRGISTKGMVILPRWDLQCTKTCLELTALTGEGFFRFQFRSIINEKESLYGRQAFKIFKKLCSKHLIDLEAMHIENGEEIKGQIEKPIIDMIDESLYNKAIGNVNHLDVHSAWAAFACKEYPVLLPVFEELYEKRKINTINKLVIVESLGMMQSIGQTKARWSHISKAGINGTNAYMRYMAQRLLDAGRKPILYNTDGIWYEGEPYHGEGEGDKMGEWKNDYEDVIIRIKGPRSYEFVDKKGKYHVILSGLTHLDRYKPRSEWQWGDLYHNDCTIITFRYDEELRRIIFDGKKEER